MKPPVILPYRLSRAFLKVGVLVIMLVIARASTDGVGYAFDPGRVASCRGADVTQISQEWAKEWSAKNVDALVALYAEDAVFLPADGSRVTGRVAIRDLFDKALAVNTADLRVHSKVTEQSANFAYDSGEYEETITSGGVKRSGQGNYLVVFKRDKDRRWRIVEHMWTDAPTTRTRTVALKDFGAWSSVSRPLQSLAIPKSFTQKANVGIFQDAHDRVP